MPTGLGDEQLWISATNDNTGTTTALNDLGAASISQYLGTGVTVAADTDEGGTYALSFDGSSTRSWLYSPSLQSNGGYFGWSVWFKVDTIGSIMSIVGGNADSNRRGGELGIDSSGALFLILNKGTGGVSNVSVTSPTSLNTGQWYHAAASGDGTTARLYLDGVEVASGLFTGFLSPWDRLMRIGSAGSGAADGGYGTDVFFFDGLIDDARFYDRTLTQTDITHLSSSRGVIGPSYSGLGDEQLWLCPSLNDSANDISGNGNDGTYNGGMTTVADSSNGGSYAYDFDGVNDWISTSFTPNTSSNDFVSYSAWISIDNQLAAAFPILTDRNGTTDGWVNFSVLVDGTSLSHRTFVPNNWYSVPLTQQSGSWVHLAQVRDKVSKEIHVYANGVFVGTSTHAGSTTHLGGEFSVGKWDNGSSGGGSARLDDIRYYDRALTQAEITHLATSRGIEGGPGGPPASVFFNPFKSHTFHTLTGKRIR